MNNSIITGLLQNVIFLIVFSLIYDYFWSRHKKPKGFLFKILAGIVLGGFSIHLMSTPWQMMPGVVFDVRSVLLSIAGLFFGIIPTIIAMIVATVYRISIGGNGIWMGVAVIISAGTIGILWGVLRPNWENKKPALELLTMGLLVHFVMLGCAIFLPEEIRILTFNKILLPTLTIYPIATILLGLLMIRWSKNWQNQERIKIEEKKYRSLLELAPEAFFHGDLDGNFTTVNNSAVELTGFSKKELLSMNMSELFSESQLMENPLNYELLKENGTLINERQIRRKNGEILSVEMSSKAMPDGTFQSFMKDISADKFAKEALKEGERNFRLVFENSPIGIYMATSEGTIIDVNHALLNILGSPSIEATKAINVLQFPPLVQNGYAAKFIQCLQDGKTLEFEMPYKTHWGRETFLHSFLVPLKDLDGKVEKVYTLIEDITERKRVEEVQKIVYKISNAAITTDNLEQLIRIIQEELGNIIDTTNFYLALYDPETDTLSLPYFADEYDSYTTFPAEKTITRYVIDTKESLLANKEMILKLENSGAIANFGADSLIWLGVPLKIEGEVIGVIAVQSYTDAHAYDVSDQIILEFISGQIGMVIQNKKAEELLRKSEERFDLAMKASNDGLFDWNLVTNEVYYSTRWKSILGYEEHELPNELSTWETLSHAEERDESLKIMQEGIAQQIGHYSIEFRMKHKLGHWVNILSRSELVYDEEGKAIRAVGTHADLTEQKKAEKDLKKAKEKAEESDRLKSAFLANMSHEIRTPMNGILGFADILKQPGLTGDEQLQYIEVIEKSGHRMLNIINDIVDISKIESGQMEAYFRETNINEQIDFIYHFFKPEVEKKGMQLSVNKSLPSAQVIIKTDREKLYAILTNLVKNAIKYTSKGSIEFGYNLKQSELHFYVKDTGIGISPDRQEAIFERFVQADIADTMALQGAGLGLTISRAYVEMLGGKMWLESDPGKGSKFYFTIPYALVKDQVTEIETENKAANEVSKRKLNILIIEDDPTSDIYLTTLVKGISKKIVHAQTGLEAIELCKSTPDLDLILMDIKMPVMDGYEATRKIREFNKEVIIIAQTAYALAGDREKAIEAGCNDYISKPIKKVAFFQMIENHF